MAVVAKEAVAVERAAAVAKEAKEAVAVEVKANITRFVQKWCPCVRSDRDRPMMTSFPHSQSCTAGEIWKRQRRRALWR